MACVEEKNQRKSKEKELDSHMKWRGDCIPLSSHQPPLEQHLGGADLYSPAAAVQSSPSLKEDQPFTPDFRNQRQQGNFSTAANGNIYLKPLELHLLMPAEFSAASRVVRWSSQA